MLQYSPYLREELAKGLRKAPKQAEEEENDNNTITEGPTVIVNQTTTKLVSKGVYLSKSMPKSMELLPNSLWIVVLPSVLFQETL